MLLTTIVCLSSHAQPRAHVYMNQHGGLWDFPIVIDSIGDMTVSSNLEQILFNVTGDQTVPFDIAHIDSLTFENEPLTETKDPYRVFQLYITTKDGRDIKS